MLRNYLVVAIRNLFKNRVYTLINLFGLSIASSTFLLISLFIFHEESYDKFHENGDRIFRVQLDRYNLGELRSQHAAGCAGIGPSLLEYFPEVLMYAKIRTSPCIIIDDDRILEIEHAVFSTEDFFRIFSFNLIAGVDSLVLSKPNALVLSASTAKRLFPDEPNLIGKLISFRNIFEAEITGIYEDMPFNSHIKFDAIFNFEQLAKFAGENVRSSWRHDGFHTYILLEEKADPKEFEAKLPAFVEQQQSEWLHSTNQWMEFHLQPIKEIHLHSNFANEFEVNGNYQTNIYLYIISFFILGIACINLLNLSTAKSLQRTKEAGVRKLVGGSKWQLLIQFMLEFLLLNLASFVLCALLFFALLPWFSELTERNELYQLIYTRKFALLVISVFLFINLLTGLYPSLLMAVTNPTQIVKGKFKSSASGIFMRKSLILFQYLVAITLLTSVYIIYKQIKYLQEINLGFDKHNVLTLKAPLIKLDNFSDRYDSFTEDLKQYSTIHSITPISELPGLPISWSSYGVRKLSDENELNVNQYKIVSIDENFIEVFRLELKAGLNVNFNDYEKYVLVNETALTYLGLDDVELALGQSLLFLEDTVQIVGVLKNYFHEPVKESTQPVIYHYNKMKASHIAIRYSGESSELIGLVGEMYQKYFAGNPYVFNFLDEKYDQQYKADIIFGKVSGLFAFIAIIITCLGLVGLSAYTIVLRFQEIGIRIVLGASVKSIVALLLKDFLVLASSAGIIAMFISWYVITDWLEDFASRIELSILYFVIPVLFTILLTVITLSFQTIKAALINPVKALKTDG